MRELFAAPSANPTKGTNHFVPFGICREDARMSKIGFYTVDEDYIDYDNRIILHTWRIRLRR